jgi:hypothetical protein
MNEYSPTLSAIAFIVGAIATIALVGAVVIAILAAGNLGPDPGRCRNTRPGAGRGQFRDVETNAELAAEWQRRWDEFNSSLDSGQPATVTFDESQATSRAAQWADETGADLGDITICFFNGEAEARGHVDIPVFKSIPVFGGIFDTDVRMRGRIELGGQQPRVRFLRSDAGDFPDWADEPISDDVASIINDRLAELSIRHRYIVTIREGQIEVTGQPVPGG